MISSSTSSGHTSSHVQSSSQNQPPLGQRQPTASAFLVSHDHDRAAELTRYLLQELKWPPHKVSLRLSVPIVTVEECSRSGKSSDLLRSQMCHWLRYSGEVPPSVPTALVSAVMAEGQRGSTAGSSSPTPPPSTGIQTSRTVASTATVGVGNNGQGNNNSNQRVADADEGQTTGAGSRSVGTALSGYISAYSAYDDDLFDDEEGSGDGSGEGGARSDAVLQRGSYASLDPYTRAQFDHLRRTVGHNFASILTDPNDPRVLASNHVAVAWDWLGNTFTETFTEGGAATSSGPIQPESVYDLLTYHPVTKATFQPYLELVSRPYNANKVEVAKMKEFQTIKSAFHRELERMGYEEENIRLLQQRQQTALDEQHMRQSDANNATRNNTKNKTPNTATASSYLEELPWPDDVPLAYFEPSFDLATLLKTIPARQNVTVWQAPPSSWDHMNPSAYLQSVKPKITTTRPHPSIVDTNEQQRGLIASGPSSSAAVSVSGNASVFSTLALENDLEGEETSVRAMLYLQQLITEMGSSEQNVELCLITHVLSQSESFFEASKSFEYLRDGSGETLSLLHDTRVGVMAKGQSVVESFLRVLRLHRRRKRLQDVTLMLQAVDRFNASLNRLDLAQNELSKAVALSFATATSAPSVSATTRHIRNLADSSTPHIAGGGQLVRGMVEALTDALRLRFDLTNNSDANLLGQINALNASTASLLMSKRNIQEIVAERAAEAIHPSQWHCADWEDIHAYLESAAEVGTLPSVLQQFQRNATHYIWQVVSGVVVPAAAGVPQRSGSSSGGGPAIAANVQSAADDPNARRAILRQCLSSLKTPHYIAQVSDIVSSLQDYSIELVAHLSTLGEVLTAICDGTVASKRAANRSSGAAGATSGAMSNLSLLDDTAVKAIVQAIVLQSLQVAIIEVLESREGGVVDGSSTSQSNGRSASTTQMTFADVETLLRVCFAFANDIEAFFGFPRNSPHTRPFRATLQSIARSFFKVQHDRQQEKMLTVLQHETWVPNEIIEGAFQDYCDHLVTSTEESISAFWSLSVEKSTMTTAGGTSAKAAGGVANARRRRAVGEGAEQDRFSSKLYINCGPAATSTSGGAEKGRDGGFVVPNSLLMLLQSLFDYDRYLAAFPFLAADLVMRIHDALKLYDGQCAGLVLGAGAVETGALPAITVAHLALASQCAGFLAELTPLLQRRLRYITGVDAFSAFASVSAAPEIVSPLSNSNSNTTSVINVNNKVAPFLQHLDRVRRDLDSHRCEYMAKIPAMVKDKVESSLWLGFLSFTSSPSPTGSPVPCPPAAAHGSQNASGLSSPNNGQPAGLEAPAGMFDPRRWAANKSQWVMAMLKECARIIKHIKPIVRSCDQQGIVVPVLAIIANKVHEAIRSISKDPTLFPTVKEHILSDLALLKANVDKFGYDTVQCATVRDVKTALAMVVRPSTDAEFYDFFFGS